MLSALRDLLFDQDATEEDDMPAWISIVGSLTLLLSSPWTLQAAPARHPAYEPATASAAAPSANLFTDAKVTASGHWSDHTPAFAIDGRHCGPSPHGWKL